MNRRFTAVLVIAAASLAPVAFAAKKESAAPAAKTATVATPAKAESLAKLAPLVPVSLATLFAYNDTVTKTESGMLIAEPNVQHVMVIKNGPEGAESACADNAHTAAAWLDKAALENLARTATTTNTGKDQ